jgi:hypothetical protein
MSVLLTPRQRQHDSPSLCKPSEIDDDPTQFANRSRSPSRKGKSRGARSGARRHDAGSMLAPRSTGAVNAYSLLRIYRPATRGSFVYCFSERVRGRWCGAEVLVGWYGAMTSTLEARRVMVGPDRPCLSDDCSRLSTRPEATANAYAPSLGPAEAAMRGDTRSTSSFPTLRPDVNAARSLSGRPPCPIRSTVDKPAAICADGEGYAWHDARRQ